MYNGNAKQGFVLSTVCNSTEMRAFESVAELYLESEQKLGKDLNQFSPEEHRAVIDQLLCNSKRPHPGTWIRLYMIRKYLRWCVAQGVPGAVDGLDGFDTDELAYVRNTHVTGPEELQERMDAVLTPEEHVEPDVLTRAFLWILFCGIPIDDAVALQRTDVDLVGLTINVGEKSFPIHPLALSSILKVLQTETFMLVHTFYTATVPRFDSPYLLRNRRSNPTYSGLRLTLARAIRRAGKEDGWLHSKGVHDSGYFYRALQGERQGKPADFTSYVLSCYDELSAQKFGLVCREKNGDYCRWKLANNIFE